MLQHTFHSTAKPILPPIQNGPYTMWEIRATYALDFFFFSNNISIFSQPGAGPAASAELAAQSQLRVTLGVSGGAEQTGAPQKPPGTLSSGHRAQHPPRPPEPPLPESRVFPSSFPAEAAAAQEWLCLCNSLQPFNMKGYRRMQVIIMKMNQATDKNIQEMLSAIPTMRSWRRALGRQKSSCQIHCLLLNCFCSDNAF